MERRHDYKTALLIEAAVHDHAPAGLAASAKVLAGMGVSVDVALRVLTRPAERRHPGERDAWTGDPSTLPRTGQTQ